MTVALVVPRPATMLGYNNSGDLEEVHSLSRYCFSLSSEFFICLVISCCSKIMYVAHEDGLPQDPYFRTNGLSP